MHIYYINTISYKHTKPRWKNGFPKFWGVRLVYSHGVYKRKVESAELPPEISKEDEMERHIDEDVALPAAVQTKMEEATEEVTHEKEGK